MNKRFLFLEITILLLLVSIVTLTGCATAANTNPGAVTAPATVIKSTVPPSSGNSSRPIPPSSGNFSGKPPASGNFTGNSPGSSNFTPMQPPNSNSPGGTSGSNNSLPPNPPGGAGGTPPGNGTGQPPSGNPGQPGGSANASVTSGTAYYTIGDTESQSGLTITVTGQDKSGVIVTATGVLTLANSTVTTSGDSSSMDSSSFYGLNAAVLAKDGGQITMRNCTITTSGTGANGVFATGQGSKITMTNVTITCYASGAHGVDATLGGTLYLNSVNITTAGNGASAAIATDRGGGTIIVTGGTVNTSGTMSPGIYSTGSITVNNATVTATGSEGAVIEGKNSITLSGTALSGQKSCGVMIYQSMSGDAATGTGDFTMTGGSLSSVEGPLFYCTNTDAVIKLTKVVTSAGSGVLLKAGAGKWGNSGSNGARVVFTADGETMNGNISCDSISSIDLTLKNNTTLTGTIDAENTGTVKLTLDNNSVWEVTGNSYLTALTDSDATLANIHSNGHNVYYDKNKSANSWLNGKTYNLTGGGQLIPM